jgi:hypothetical protein
MLKNNWLKKRLHSPKCIFTLVRLLSGYAKNKHKFFLDGAINGWKIASWIDYKIALKNPETRH